MLLVGRIVRRPIIPSSLIISRVGGYPCSKTAKGVIIMTFKSLLGAKRYCASNNLLAYEPVIVHKESFFSVFNAGEPIGNWVEGDFTRWAVGTYKKVARWSNLRKSWVDCDADTTRANLSGN